MLYGIRSIRDSNSTQFELFPWSASVFPTSPIFPPILPLSFYDSPMRLYHSTFLEKMEDRRIFAKKLRWCRLYLRKRTQLNYDKVVEMSVLRIFSWAIPIDVLEFLKSNISWLDVLSKIWYHNCVDEFLSQNKQTTNFAGNIEIFTLHVFYHFVDWTEAYYRNLNRGIFLVQLLFRFPTFGESYIDWVRSKNDIHGNIFWTKIKST